MARPNIDETSIDYGSQPDMEFSDSDSISSDSSEESDSDTGSSDVDDDMLSDDPNPDPDEVQKCHKKRAKLHIPEGLASPGQLHDPWLNQDQFMEQGQREALQDQVESLQARIKTLEEENQKKAEAISKLKFKAVSDLNTRKVGYIGRLKNRHSRQNKQILELKGEIVNLRKELTEKNNRIISLKVEIGGLKLENSQNKIDMNYLECSEYLLEEEHKEESSKKDKMIKSLTAEITELKDRVTQKDRNINSLIADNMNLEVKVTQKDIEIHSLKFNQAGIEFTLFEGLSDLGLLDDVLDEMDAPVEMSQNPENILEDVPPLPDACDVQAEFSAGGDESGNNDLSITANFASMEVSVKSDKEDDTANFSNNSWNSSLESSMNSGMEDSVSSEMEGSANSSAEETRNHDTKEAAVKSEAYSHPFAGNGIATVVKQEVVNSGDFKIPIVSSSKKIKKKDRVKNEKKSPRSVSTGYLKWTDDRNLELLNGLIEVWTAIEIGTPHPCSSRKDNDVLSFVGERCNFDCGNEKIRYQIINLLKRHHSDTVKDIKSTPQKYLAALISVRNKLSK